MNVEAVYQVDGSVELTFPFNRRLVDAIKEAIPARWRTYSPDSRTWTVWPPHDDVAVRLVRAHFPSGSRPEQRSQRSAAPTPLRPHDADYAELHLLPTAPPELVEAAFKVLARRHHPDLGGDTETMARLNSAVEVLRQRRAVAS